MYKKIIITKKWKIKLGKTFIIKSQTCSLEKSQKAYK